MPNSERRSDGSRRNLWNTPVYNPDTGDWAFISPYEGTTTAGSPEYIITDTGTGGFSRGWKLYKPYEYKPNYPEPEIKDGILHLKPAKFATGDLLELEGVFTD